MRLRKILYILLIVVFFGCDKTAEEEKDRFQGKKLVTIGDSLTASCGWQHGWQKYLVNWFGFNWSKEETVNGVDGHAATAIGGTWVKPINESSIYIRSFDVKYYNPDIIFLYVASNDPYYYWISKDNSGKNYEEIVEKEPVYLAQEVNKEISTLSAYKGIIEQLLENCPKAKIYIIGIMPIRYEIGMCPTEDFANLYPTDTPRFPTLESAYNYEMSERWPKHELTKAVAKKYGLDFIDLWELSGINIENAKLYYGDVAGDCTQVHPNDEGEKKIAESIRNYLLFN